MPTTLPIPLEFRLPEGWLPAHPARIEAEDVAFAAVHPRPDAGFAANITIDGGFPLEGVTLVQLAEASLEQLRQGTESLVVADRREVGPEDAPALTQRLAISAVINGTSRDLVQSQVYLSLADTLDPHKRALIRLALTATAAQHDAVLGDFQDFLRTVRPETEEGAR
ncbi:hypothetical protein [Streptomyces violascens]|uniref:hypothetical protein n=1 Tax=Streptomyces violascens TaxID=67381 RepID=UPI0036C7D7D1